MRIFSNKNDSDKSLSDQCLSDLQLTTLLEGRLKTKEKKSFIRHINRCHDCRFDWMEASSHISSLAPSQDRKFSLRGWLRPINAFPASFRVVSGFAAISLLLVSVIIMRQATQPDIDSLLNQQYAQLNYQKNAINTQQAIENIPLPWEHGTFGFSSPYAESSSLAFAAGLWLGRNSLSELNDPLPKALIQTQSGDWNTSEQNIHYQLGRWFTSLWYAAQLNDNIDSTQQFKILEKFNQQLQTKKTTDNQIIKALKSIARLDIILKNFEQKKISQEQLREQLEIIMAILSPVSLTEPS